MSAYEFLKYGLLPGTLGLLMLGLVAAWAALQSNRPRLAKWLIGTFVVTYFVCGTEAGAWCVGRMVAGGYASSAEGSVLRDVEAVVILDGGTNWYHNGDQELAVVSRTSAVRSLEAVRVYRLAHPQLVVVTAGNYVEMGNTPEGGAIRDVLVSAGVPRERVVLDTASRNTREHGINVSALLRDRKITRCALVTSAVHMRRAMRAFAGTGLQVIAAPAPLVSPGKFAWWPSTSALDRSFEAWYEVFGLIADTVR